MLALPAYSLPVHAGLYAHTENFTFALLLTSNIQTLVSLVHTPLFTEPLPMPDLYLDIHTHTYIDTHTCSYTRAHTAVTPQSLDPQLPWPRAARPDGLGDSWLEVMSSDCCDGRSHTGMLREKGKEADDGKAEEGGGLRICLSPFCGSSAWDRHPGQKASVVPKTRQVLNSIDGTPELAR